MFPLFLLACGLLLTQLVAPNAARADDDAVPRFASVKSSKVNVRQGPGEEFNIKYQYTRRGYPVKVIAEAGDWWLIEDPDGDSGWVSKKLLSTRRTVFVTGDNESPLPVALRAEASGESAVLAAIEPGVILTFEQVEGTWCLVEYRGGGAKHEGWVHLSHIWGGHLED